MYSIKCPSHLEIYTITKENIHLAGYRVSGVTPQQLFFIPSLYTGRLNILLSAGLHTEILNLKSEVLS